MLWFAVNTKKKKILHEICQPLLTIDDREQPSCTAGLNREQLQIGVDAHFATLL
jgi:hypothetical protein